MLTSEDEAAAEAMLDKRKLQSLGVLLPIRLSALSFFSGRHPLGRAGEGMRFLRTRPFESRQDRNQRRSLSRQGQEWTCRVDRARRKLPQRFQLCRYTP